MAKVYRALLLCASFVLFFSFWPWINFGANGTMNFDLSLPLIWLVLFDIVAFILIIKKKLFSKIFDKWEWLILPLFLTLSILWSQDKLRSILIIGVLWLLYFAVFAFVVLKEEAASERFWRLFLKIFFGTGLFVCGWCVVQCIMNVAGIPRDNTLLCKGCVYEVFGFPHPNGFAAEPQFMGSLLIAPILTSLYLLVSQKFFSKRNLAIMLFVFVTTLFLTLSRGAIYSCMVAMVFFTIVWGAKKNWRVMKVWLVVLLAFLFALNLQGIFAEVSKTDDTYVSGVSKAVNQLTLGIVDLGGSQVRKDGMKDSEVFIDHNEDGLDDEKAIFDGYVEVSTSTRIDTWRGALKTWSKDLKTMLFGVGLGGGLISMYENGVISSSREIINNQYISLLLESGIVGVALLVLSLVLVWKAIYKKPNSLLIFALVVAYMMSTLFFSGLPNALHIYLLPALIFVMFEKRVATT